MTKWDSQDDQMGKPEWPNDKTRMTKWEKPRWSNEKPPMIKWRNPRWPNEKTRLTNWENQVDQMRKPPMTKWENPRWPNEKTQDDQMRKPRMTKWEIWRESYSYVDIRKPRASTAERTTIIYNHLPILYLLNFRPPTLGRHEYIPYRMPVAVKKPF